MGIFIKKSYQILWLIMACALLIWSSFTFSEEREFRRNQGEQSANSIIDSHDHKKENSYLSQLILNAQLTNNNENIMSGLVWRVYAPILGNENKLLLVAIYEGGTARFDLKPGSYLIHVSFGHASSVEHVSLENGQHLIKNFNLDAGGVVFNSTLFNGTINEKELRFTIYEDEKENDDTGVILANVKAQSVVRLKAGHYHVVSHYGSVNAIIRSDIQVEAGKITEVTLEHQAAQIILKLVRQEGGEALADTSWSITNDSGDIIYETVGSYVLLVLVEGDYIAIAKNKDKIYQKVFSVISGHDKDVNVIANSKNIQQFNESMD